MPLTPRQQRFVQEYLTDLNATQAAVRAGFSAKTAGQIGARLLKDVKVRAEIVKGQGKAADRNELTVDAHLAELDRLATHALAAGQVSAAIRAQELRGKVAGFYVERHEDVTSMTPEQRRARLAQLLGL